MNRLAGWCGFAGVAGNIAGVAVLGDIPSAYRPGDIASWVREVLASPVAASTSAVAFTLGLIALATWALILGARLDTIGARCGSYAIALGALINAAGTPAQLVLAQHLGPLCRAGTDCSAAGAGLLGMSLAFDALFNLLLGAGLICIATALRRRPLMWRWLAPLTFVAGIASIPVSLQVVSDTAARLLVIAGPLWLAAIAALSVLLWRDRV